MPNLRKFAVTCTLFLHPLSGGSCGKQKDWVGYRGDYFSPAIAELVNPGICMHEMSIALSVVDAITARAREEQAEKVTAIELVAGKLSGVEIESLKFCFSAAVRGTIMEDAELMVTVPLSEGLCEVCGERFAVDGHYTQCRSCGSYKVTIVSGKELSIRSITLE